MVSEKNFASQFLHVRGLRFAPVRGSGAAGAADARKLMLWDDWGVL